MKIKVWVCTNKVGSKSERTVTIDDEEFEDADEEAKQERIDEAVNETINDMIESGYQIIEE